MADKNDLFDFDETTAANNDNVQGANIAENCAPSGINNAIRGLASIVKRAVGSQGSAIPSAATTPIGASGTALYTIITGNSTITSFGSVAAGTLRILEFAGSLTLAHNATSLRLPGASNILTTTGDVGIFVSLGSGGWKCVYFGRVDGAAVTSFTGTITSIDAGATGGPNFVSDRSSASPAVNDTVGGFIARGRNSIGNVVDYVSLVGLIADPANGSEDGFGQLRSRVAGVDTPIVVFGPGLQVGAPTGSDKGIGTLNAAAGVYIAGHGTIAQVVRDIESAYLTLATILPHDNSIPQNTEGDEVLAVTITPVNSGSTLRIRAMLNIGGGTGAQVGAALFVDSVASAISAASASINASGTMQFLILEHTVTAGSTSARTYKIRAGSDTATDANLNGDIATRIYGGVAISRLEVEEILPQ
jgi:hypothetical protein